MTSGATGAHGPLGTREIRALRARGPARSPGDPWAAPPVVAETERFPGGGTAPALTLFLVGAECPFTCVFCDLWRHTLDGPTPPGALVAQVEAALARRETPLAETVVKLYNASNFFERRAVPSADRDAIADRLAGALRVVVECHPRLVGEECFDFAGRIGGALEVAMGLETVHPEAFARLNKGMALGDFAAAAGRLRERGIAVRAFVQVGVPWVPPEESVEWAVRSAEHAFAAGAGHAAVIPTRGGPGAMDELLRRGDFVPPTLGDLEAALDGCLELPAARAGAVATADLWDLDALADCASCLQARRERLERMNLTGEPEPAVSCEACRR